MKNPTWSELRHYVYFLSSQLFKIEASSFTSLAVVEDLPGFRKFVVNFMFRMAQVSDGFISYSVVVVNWLCGPKMHRGCGSCVCYESTIN